MPKKFAFCTRFLPPMWSGQAVVISRLLKGLSPDQYCLVTQPVYEKFTEHDYIGQLPAKYHFLPKEYTIKSLLSISFIRWVNFFISVIQRAYFIRKSLIREDIESIVVGTGDQIDLPAAWLATKWMKCRFFIYFFDDYSTQFWEDKQMLPIIRWIEKKLVKGAEGVLVPNEVMQKVIKDRHKKMGNIIRNPYYEGANDNSDVSSYLTTNSSLSIVFTGAVYSLNYDVLKNIAMAIQKTGLNAKLHIYTAQDFSVLRREGLQGETIVLHRHVSQQEAVKVHLSADILLIPFSFQKGASEIVKSSGTAKLADYLKSGKPILAICQEDCYLSKYLKEHDCGVVVSSLEANTIADAIVNILRNADLRERMGQNARERAQIDFDPKNSQLAFLQSIGVKM